MSLTKAWVTGGGGGGRSASSGEVLKTGYIKKLKTMKKKFFVLRAESGESPSCLEYYDNEKKWKANQAPKRVITLKSCFNINRRWDLKQRFVVALYTKDDCFCLALDSEEEADQWLSTLLSTQRGGDDSAEGEPPKPTFEHVWQVQVQKKGLGSSRNILGPYMLCLTSHSLTLVRNGSGTPTTTSSGGQGTTSTINDILHDTVEFSLSTIRRCGYSDCFFYMEVGRSSVTGAGELWMQTEDTYIAQNMHGAILHAMSSSRNGSTTTPKVDKEADLGPHPRTRSSSANEASRPVSVLQRGSSARYTQQSNQAQHGSNAPSPGSISAPAPSAVGGTWRPQALPHPHSQHTSQQQRFGGWVGGGQRVHHAPITHQQPPTATSPSQRRHSVSGTGSRERCDSLPSRARTISEGLPSSSLPTSHHPSPPTACSPSSTHHHHHHVLHHIHVLHHPSMGSGAGSQYGQHGIMMRGVHLVPSGPTPAGGRPHSMYSRGYSYSPPIISSPVSPASGACSTTDSAGSSLSMEEGEGWCGSNGGMGMQEAGEMGYGVSSATSHGPRYGHSLTPDEPAILEENADDEYMPWGPGEALEMEEEEIAAADAEDEDDKLKNGGEEEGDEVDGVVHTRRKHSRKGRGRNPGDYVPMGAIRSRTFPSPNAPTPAPTPHMVAPSTVSAPHHHSASLSLPIQPVSLRPSPLHKTPPSGYSRSQQGFKSGSPSSQGAYMEMHSPCGTSPMESSDGYMPMSPGSGGSASIPADISATKALQSVQQEGGYVPMTPGHPPDDGYVDMDPNQNANNKGHHEDGSMSGRGEMSPAASSCSVTSGTPSTDTRFSEYHLEKVSSYFTPSEEEEDGHGGSRGDDILPMERPVRAYSVGSRPETFRKKNWLEVSNIDSTRVRAFSVGSRQGGAGRPPGPSRSVGGASSHHSPHRHLPHHTHVFAPSPMAPTVRRGASSPKGAPSSQGKKNSKSSSAPVLQALSSSWSGSSTLCSPPGSTPSPYSQASGSIHPKQPINADSVDHDLMELDFSGRGRRTDTTESPGVTSLPTASKKKQESTAKEESPYVPMGVPAPNSNYQEMKMTEAPPSSFSPPLLLSPPSGGVVGGKAPSSASSASSSVTLEEYVDMNFKKEEGSSDSGNANSGYMEMWPARKSSSEGAPGDYVNMDGGERSSRTKGSIPEASRPIAIRKERREDGGVVGGGGKESGRGSSPNFSLAGLLSRKSSSGTPPKGPFSDTSSSPFSSLRRGRKKRGGEEEESEGGDEGSSHKESGDLHTPTAIFPFSLNSPGSPVRPFPGHYESASKCPVDATSGTVHISYPYVPSSPVATAGSVMPSRAKSDVRRRSEYSVPGGGSGNSGSPPKRDSKHRNERPLSQSSPITMDNINTSTSPPSALSPPTSSHEYANYCPSPPKQGSGKSASVGSDDYMPMAPSGRVRKESVVSGPGELMAMAHSMNNAPIVTSSSSSLFSSFSPSASFSGTSRPRPLSDYVCMKALPSSSPALSSVASTRAAVPQRVKSSSADYLEIKVGLDTHQTIPKPSNNADDYVEIDLSKKPGVIVEKTVPKPGGGAAVSAPKTIPSVGTYVPSHTGFGFHPQFSSSMSTSSSRLPPPPASYTWPRKGLEMRKEEVPGASNCNSAVPTTSSRSSNGGKTDDYVQMDLGPKSIPSSSSTTTHHGYKGSISLTFDTPVRRYLTGVPPPSTTATVTATTTTTTSVTSSTSSLSTSLITSVANSSSMHSPLSSTSVTALPPSYKPFSSLATHDPKRLHNSMKSPTSSQSLQATTATTVPLKERTPPPTVVDTSITLPSSTCVSTATSTSVISPKVVTSSDMPGVSSAAMTVPSPHQFTIFTVSSVTSSTASVTYSSAPIVVSATPSPLVSSFASVVACSSRNTTAGSASCVTSPSCAQNLVSAPRMNCAAVMISTPVAISVSTKGSGISTTSSHSVSSMSASMAAVTQSESLETSITCSPKPQITSTNHSITSSSLPVVTSSALNLEVMSNKEGKDSQVLEKSDKLQSDHHPSPHKSNGNRQKAQMNIMPSSKPETEGESKGQREKSDCVTSISDNPKDLSSDCCLNVVKLDNSHSTLNESLEVNLSERSTESSTTETAGVASRTAHRTDSKRGRGGSSTREVCRRNSGDKTEGGHLPRRGSEERALGRGRSGDGSEVRGTRTRRRSSDIAKNQDTQQGCKLNRQGSGLSRTGLQDGEDDNGSYEKLLAPGGRQQRKWQHNNSLGERTTNVALAPGLGPLRRQMSSPSAVPDPDGAYEKLLPTNGAAPSRRRSGDKVGNMGLLVGESIPTQVFSASSSSASSSSSLASVASSVLLGPATLRSMSTSSPPPTALPTAPPSPGEIHYASLDLAPPTNMDAEDGGRCGRRSPRVFASRSGAESPSTTGTSGSLQAEQPLNYAEIDFSKSVAPSVKNRVRH